MMLIFSHTRKIGFFLGKKVMSVKSSISLALPCFLLPMKVKLIMDDETKVKIKKMKRRYSSVTPVLLRIIGSLLTMLLLLWTICCGYQLTMEPWRYTAVAAQAFHVGVATMAFGFLFLMVGVSILANMLFNMSEKLPELSTTHQGEKTRTRTASKAIAKAKVIVIVITVLMISWATYMAFKLETETGDSMYHLLTVSIGVTNILFGLIYFIIGLTIVLDLSIDFWNQLQQNEGKNTKFHHDCIAEFKCPP